MENMYIVSVSLQLNKLILLMMVQELIAALFFGLLVLLLWVPLSLFAPVLSTNRQFNYVIVLLQSLKYYKSKVNKSCEKLVAYKWTWPGVQIARCHQAISCSNGAMKRNIFNMVLFTTSDSSVLQATVRPLGYLHCASSLHSEAYPNFLQNCKWY